MLRLVGAVMSLLTLLSCGTQVNHPDQGDVAASGPRATESADEGLQLTSPSPIPHPDNLLGSIDSDTAYDSDWVRGWATDRAAVSPSESMHYSINVDVRFRNSDGTVPAGCPERLRIPASHSRPDIVGALNPTGSPGMLKSSAVGFDLFVPVKCRSATSVSVHALSWSNPDGVYRLIGTKSVRFGNASALSRKTTATLYALHHVHEFGWMGLAAREFDEMDRFRMSYRNGAPVNETMPADVKKSSFGVEESLFAPTPSVYAPGARAITTMPANLSTSKAYPNCFMSLTPKMMSRAPAGSFYWRLNMMIQQSFDLPLLLRHQNQCVFDTSNASLFETDLAPHVGHEIFPDSGYLNEQLVRFATQQAQSLSAAGIDVVILDNSNLPEYRTDRVDLGDELQTNIPIDRFVEAMYHVNWRYRLCKESNQPGNEGHRWWCDVGYGPNQFKNPPPKIALLQTIHPLARQYLSDRLFPLSNQFSGPNSPFFEHAGKKVIFYVEPDESDVHDKRRPDSFAISDLWRNGFLPVPMWTHVSANGSINTSNHTRVDFVGTCIKAMKVQQGDTKLYPISSAASDGYCGTHVPKYTPLGASATIGPTYTVPGGLSSQAYANSGFNFGLTMHKMYESVRSPPPGSNPSAFIPPDFLVIGSWNQHGAKQHFLLGNPTSYGRLQYYRNEPNEILNGVQATDCPANAYASVCDKRKELTYKLAERFHTAQWRGLPVGFGMVRDPSVKWNERHFLGKGFAECNRLLHGGDDSGRNQPLYHGAQRINFMFDCTMELQNWIRSILPDTSCYNPNSTPIMRNFFDCGVETLLNGSTWLIPSEASKQFAHTYDTWTSEYSPDFEPTIAAGMVRHDKFYAVAAIADSFKNSRSNFISHAGYHVIRLATTVPKFTDQNGWFVYSIEDPVSVRIPGIQAQGIREVCIGHEFQSFACFDRFETRAFNGPFYLLRNADPALFDQLYRCEKVSGPGFIYANRSNVNNARSCTAMGWMSKARSPQNIRVVRRCAFSADLQQEFLVIDARCPVANATEIGVLGYIN